MNLTNLKWTKNIRRADGAWAYSEFKAYHLFKLAWRDNEPNANKPQKDDSNKPYRGFLCDRLQTKYVFRGDAGIASVGVIRESPLQFVWFT